jgi:hypothetical protein
MSLCRTKRTINPGKARASSPAGEEEINTSPDGSPLGCNPAGTRATGMPAGEGREAELRWKDACCLLPGSGRRRARR